jgi:hypothetical protein
MEGKLSNILCPVCLNLIDGSEGLAHWCHPTMTATRPENILEEANRLVSGDRQASYKHPNEDYACTAAIWQAMILKRFKIDVPLTPDFCCLMMAAMKISREAGLHKRDNLTDLAGYARCVEMCLEEAPPEI